MAWLQNLADKAEDLLNKIDKNAATVLNDKPEHTQIEILSEIIHKRPTTQEIKTTPSVKSLGKLSDSDKNAGDAGEQHSVENSSSETSEDGGISILNHTEQPGNNMERSTSTTMLSRENSFQLVEEYQCNYEDKIAKLETENIELNEQMLKVQHLYSELQNEYTSIHTQLDRANESVLAAQSEMEQYKNRAQRILQEKEKLISLNSDNGSTSQNSHENNILNNYNTQLKQELIFQQEKSNELNQKYNSLNNDFFALQKQYVDLQSSHQKSIQNFQERLRGEKNIKEFLEEECRKKTLELQVAQDEAAHQGKLLKYLDSELNQTRNCLKESSNIQNNDIELRLHSLTQTLIVKQNTLETVTSDRNALRIQLEKLENEYQKLLSQDRRTQVIITDANETDDVKSQVPKFMVPSPFDAGMTRRVKHAYSTLDAISVRTGVFLRRYPLARVFVFSYMVLLHFWMMIILCTYMPSNK